MPRPTMNVYGSEYQEILKQREMIKEYGADYPQMKHALDMLDKLEKKKSSGLLAYEDKNLFEDIKSTIHTIEAKRKGETVDKHTTAYYKWRTVGDSRVRSRHSKLNGKVFSWGKLPPGGEHPGDDYGCRCWAEAYDHQVGSLEEGISQTVVSPYLDASHMWDTPEFSAHYLSGNGKPVQLSEIGLLGRVIDQSRKVIFPKVEAQIFEKARANGTGTFSWDFNNAYNFTDVALVFRTSTVSGECDVKVTEKGNFLLITTDIYYSFYDEFTDTISIAHIQRWFGQLPEKMKEKLKKKFPNLFDESSVTEIENSPITKPIRKPILGEWDIPLLTDPYIITDTWTTHLEIVVKKE